MFESNYAVGAGESQSPVINVLQCPACADQLRFGGDVATCLSCSHDYTIQDGVPQLYVPNEWDAGKADVTDDVKAFYEDSPFPNYDDFDSAQSLVNKAQKGLFAHLLDKQVPAGAQVLEAGCGTGQLSIFLSLRNRRVVGADLCLNSLKMGSNFARQHGLQNVNFVQMNLFKPPFKTGSFHLVICNGVLHHTSDPKGGFESLTRLVKPGGYILIGLYHQWGRLITDARRVIFNLTGDRFKALDPNLGSNRTSTAKKDAWFADQYKHPHESKHTIAESIQWLEDAGIEFVSSIPSTRLFNSFSPDTELFTPVEPAGRVEMAIAERMMFFQGSQEGGFFTIIGRKPQ